jgi:hypothetical protein
MMSLSTDLLNNIFERNSVSNEIKSLLTNFDKNINNLNFKKGFYIYGSSGVGKTEFVVSVLKEMNYDVIRYDAGDSRNKGLIDNIASNNIASRNVLDMMYKKVRKIAIVMDEIDGMNSGDKGGLTALIKLIRQKKTKKQKMESMTLNPIFCIGNYNMDKKIKELLKVCNVFELKTPTNQQMTNLITHIFPTIEEQKKTIIENYVMGDLRKLKFIQTLYKKSPESIDSEILSKILNVKTFNEDTNKITHSLLMRKYNLTDHNKLMNETDRTTVALLWHENIVDHMPKDPRNSLPFYHKFLENTCFSDYIDRITFQNQIWHLNEMSSLMKTFNNNRIYHKVIGNMTTKVIGNATTKVIGNTTTKPPEIRFTKVLTKYSTEYNNTEFIYSLCQKLDMDKKDLIAYFQELRTHYGLQGDDFLNNISIMNALEKLFDTYEITKLDIKRIYRYIDHNVKKADIKEIDEIEDE